MNGAADGHRVEERFSSRSPRLFSRLLITLKFQTDRVGVRLIEKLKTISWHRDNLRVRANKVRAGHWFHIPRIQLTAARGLAQKQDVSSASEILVTRLRSIHPLDDRECDAVRALPFQLENLPRKHDIVREGQHPKRSCLIVRGLTCWYRLGEGGKRQIANIHVPGDIPDLQSLHLEIMDSSLATLTPCVVAFVAHDAIVRLCAAEPNVANAMWKMTLIEGAIFRAWITNIGGRPAYNRVAHLLCEMFARSRAVVTVGAGSFELPLNQSDLADATGLSLVHVNRVLVRLRKDGLIELQGGSVVMKSRNRLSEVGEFDATYLHLLGQSGTV